MAVGGESFAARESAVRTDEVGEGAGAAGAEGVLTGGQGRLEGNRADRVAVRHIDDRAGLGAGRCFPLDVEAVADCNEGVAPGLLCLLHLLHRDGVVKHLHLGVGPGCGGCEASQAEGSASGDVRCSRIAV